MQGRCEDHVFERASDVCGRCGGEFCADCTVYPFGNAKPPLCRPCAVLAAGVRQHAARPAMSRRERKLLAARRQQLLGA